MLVCSLICDYVYSRKMSGLSMLSSNKTANSSHYFLADKRSELLLETFVNGLALRLFHSSSAQEHHSRSPHRGALSSKVSCIIFPNSSQHARSYFQAIFVLPFFFSFHVFLMSDRVNEMTFDTFL